MVGKGNHSREGPVLKGGIMNFLITKYKGSLTVEEDVTNGGLLNITYTSTNQLEKK